MSVLDDSEFPATVGAGLVEFVPGLLLGEALRSSGDLSSYLVYEYKVGEALGVPAEIPLWYQVGEALGEPVEI